MSKIKHCDTCHDGNGGCVFPYYGLAPHVHHQTILGTEFTHHDIPQNFCPDPDEREAGTYTHCLACGADGRYDLAALTITEKHVLHAEYCQKYKPDNRLIFDLDTAQFIPIFKVVAQEYAKLHNDLFGLYGELHYKRITQNSKKSGTKPVCIWSGDQESNWHTECGNIFVLNNGGPSDHRMQFCCYCGDELLERKYEPDEVWID